MSDVEPAAPATADDAALPRAQVAAGLLVSLLLLLASWQRPAALAPVEAVAVVSYAWSVWLLARNQPAGWWVGLLGCALYGWVFYGAQLYAEVGIQAFYFVTSLQAILIWMRGGADRAERPVGRIPPRWLLLSAALAVVGTLLLRALLIHLRGAAPFWDALTTVLSLIAHLYLMARAVESWYLWITVDVIYVPLYASRELYVTSALYAVFLVLAIKGLITFRRLYRERLAAEAGGGPG